MSLPEELDKWVSIYVRCRYANPHTGQCFCYTCPARMHWKMLDAGHWQLRGNRSLRYEVNQMRAQCVTCNREMNGRPDVFEEELRAELGDDKVDAFLKTKNEYAGFTDEWYAEQIEYFKSTVKQMSAYNTVLE